MVDETQDWVQVCIDEQKIDGKRGWLDVTGVDALEIRIKHDGSVVWINAKGGLFRACCIRGEITVIDDRQKCRRKGTGSRSPSKRPSKAAITRSELK